MFGIIFDWQTIESCPSQLSRPCSCIADSRTPHASIISNDAYDFATLLPFAFFFGVSLMDKPGICVSTNRSALNLLIV